MLNAFQHTSAHLQYKTCLGLAIAHAEHAASADVQSMLVSSMEHPGYACRLAWLLVANTNQVAKEYQHSRDNVNTDPVNHDIRSYEQQQADIFAELEPVFDKYANVQVHADIYVYRYMLAVTAHVDMTSFRKIQHGCTHNTHGHNAASSLAGVIAVKSHQHHS